MNNSSCTQVLPSSGRHEITSCITSSYYSFSANAYGLPRKDYYRALGIRKPESEEYTTESNIRVTTGDHHGLGILLAQNNNPTLGSEAHF